MILKAADTVKRALLLVFLWLPQSDSWAIEEPTEIQGSELKTPSAGQAGASDKEKSKASKPKKESTANQKSFVPQEKISADTAVSFPADI